MTLLLLIFYRVTKMSLHIMGNMLKIESQVTFAPLCTEWRRRRMIWNGCKHHFSLFDLIYYLFIRMDRLRKTVEKLHKDSCFPGRQWEMRSHERKQVYCQINYNVVCFVHFFVHNSWNGIWMMTFIAKISASTWSTKLLYSPLFRTSHIINKHYFLLFFINAREMWGYE
jgi:hypothetical protein